MTEIDQPLLFIERLQVLYPHLKKVEVLQRFQNAWNAMRGDGDEGLIACEEAVHIAKGMTVLAELSYEAKVKWMVAQAGAPEA